jgi:hypothetical protein
MLGRAPCYHRTDNLSAATHELAGGGRVFNDRYVGALGHYGVLPDRSTPGRGHQDGDVEQSHHRLKRTVEQALLLRGSREFDLRAHYERFVVGLMAARNRPRARKLEEELARMHDLPLTRLDDFRQERARVTSFSNIRVAGNICSVASRLMGEHVDVRLYPERLEVFYAGERVAEMERLRGEGGAVIDYRHLIWSLVRKPGATCSIAPFFFVVQPSSWTVRTSWSGRSTFSLRGRQSSRRTRIREQRLLRLLESGHRLLPGHGREVSQKLIEGVASFEVIEKRLEGNPCPHENGGAAEDFRIAVNYGGSSTHGSLLIKCP